MSVIHFSYQQDESIVMWSVIASPFMVGIGVWSLEYFAPIVDVDASGVWRGVGLKRTSCEVVDDVLAGLVLSMG